jgi:predicted metal-dependent hydrolase
MANLEHLYHRGIELFNRQEFFECHDTLEELWLEDHSPDRLFYQGLIQAAVAFYHVTNGKLGAARTMMIKALEKLSRYPDVHREIGVAGLIGALREWKELLDKTISEGGALAECSFPRIEFIGP